MEWFDSHCHLYDVEEPIDEVVERARAAGVAGMLVLGTDPENSQVACDLTRFPGVYAGAAWHPTSTKGWSDAWAQPIDDLLGDARVVAVGESGIDLYWDKTYLADQERALRAHIALSKKHDKALVIHTRDSVDETLAILRDAGPPERLVFHCWSGTKEQLRDALGLGAYISFAGNLSFKKSEELRAACALVPEDRLLVETDSPYLTPEPHRGKRNEPAFVVHTGAAVAVARETDPERIAELTSANARLLFAL